MEKLRRIGGGRYETHDGLYAIERDDYEALRENAGDGRHHTTYYDGLYIAPAEVCWIVLQGEQNLGMYDTLREARAALARLRNAR